MVKCAECIHLGSLKPKKGGIFTDREGRKTTILEPSIPYCGRLNFAVCSTDSYITCNYHTEYKPEPKDPQPANTQQSG